MIRWVFLDIGGVILDEDVLAFHVFSAHARAIRRRHPDRSIAELIAERERIALAGSRWATFELASDSLPEDEVSAIWDELEPEVRRSYGEFLPPIEGAVGAIADLARDFRLGLIANQPAEARGVLESLGVLGRFEVICLSGEMGLSKPDPALFLEAQRRAGASPGDCLMVGDRPGVDLEPASHLGWQTAWIRGSPHRDDDPADLRAFRESLRRIEAAVARRFAPTFVLESLADLSGVYLKARRPS